MQLFNPTSALTSQDVSSKEEQQGLHTAKQWLTKFSRFPRRGEIGKKKDGYNYYCYQQTQLVRSEVHYHPLPDVQPISDKYRGKKFYYDGECEIKLTRKQWRELHNRVVNEGVVACEEDRQGFNPRKKAMLYRNFYLFADTSPIS